MNTREYLMSYVDMTTHELNELKAISWPQDRHELNKRMFSLQKLLQRTIYELDHIDEVRRLKLAEIKK